MKIKNFKATNLYGYLNLDINFYDDLSFLTGINGSGKTTVVRGIVSLLKPSFSFLSNMKYDSISVAIEFKNKKIKLYSKKVKEKIILGYDIFNGQKNEADIASSLNHIALDFDEDILEDDERYLGAKIFKEGELQVFKFFSSLPKPITLGIERRASELVPERYIRRIIPYTSSYRRKSLKKQIGGYFGYSPQLSVENAKDLAEGKYSDIQAEQKKATEELRNSLVTQAITIRENTNFDLENIPELKNKVRNININEIISTITKLGGLEDAKIKNDLEKIYSKLKKYSNELPDTTRISLDSPDFKKYSKIYLDFILDQSQLDRILTIFDLIKKYNEKTRKINIPIDNYLKTINKFLWDSNKSIYFDKNDELKIEIKNLKDRSISELSSGEIQVITIITQIAFDRDIDKANVFIIDEPELSLHVKWQEIFVETLRELKSELQMIIATHSPPIFSNYIDKCISLKQEYFNE